MLTSMSHHHHDHQVSDTPLRTLVAVIALTSVVCVAEFSVGLLSGSLALVSDSAHMLSDSTGLVISLLAMLVARRAANSRATYGYGRVEVIAAVVNALTVIAMTVFIVIEAFRRAGHAHHVSTGSMATVAVVGLVVNIMSAMLLMRSQEENINVRGAYLHVLADLCGSLAVLLAAAVIWLTGFEAADTIASIVIAVLIIPRSISLLRDAMSVLLERAPAELGVEKVTSWIEEFPEVESAHDVHVWSLDGHRTMCTCHVTLTQLTTEEQRCAFLDAVTSMLATRGIDHATIQIEPAQHVDHEVHGCGRLG